MSTVLSRVISPLALEGGHVATPEVDDLETMSEDMQTAQIALATEVACMECDDAQKYADVQCGVVDKLTVALENSIKVAQSMESIVNDKPWSLSQQVLSDYHFAFESSVVGGVKNPIFSTESLTTSSQVVSAAELSVERLKSTILDIWNKVYTAVRNALKAIKDAIGKLFTAVRALRGKVDKLRLSVSDKQRKGATLKGDSKIKVTHAARLHMGGVFNKQIFLNGINLVDRHVYSTANVLSKLATQNQNDLTKTLSGSVTIEDILAVSKIIEDRTMQVMRGIPELESPVELPGSRQLHWENHRMWESSNKAITIKQIPNYRRYAGGGEMGILSMQEIIQVVTSVRNFCDEYEKDERQRKELYDQHGKNITQLDRTVKRLANADELSQSELSTISDITYNAVNDSVRTLDSFVFNYNRSILSVAEQCADQYT